MITASRRARATIAFFTPRRIVPDNGQQSTVQVAELLAKHPPNNEQRFDQHGQVGKALDKLRDARVDFPLATTPTLRPKLRKSTAQVVLDGNGLRLKQLAMGQQHAQLLTAKRLHPAVRTAVTN